MLRLTDPRVRELAELFVDAVPHATFWPPAVREELVDRAAGAVQQALEQELDAIRRDLEVIGAVLWRRP